MKKTFIGLFTALLLVGMLGCKNGVESGGSSGSGGGGESNISTPYTKVGTQTIGGIKYDIVTFGTFPQSEKNSTVSITSETKIVGSFTYYKGDDNEWYAELKSKYYKVEPIKWRVLTTNYDHDGNASTPGKKLLLAESILINCMYYDYDSVNRTISAATVYPNNYEHSRIRAYLNGLSYQKKARDSGNQESDETFVNKGFFQTAFTQAEQDAISETIVDNTKESLKDAAGYLSTSETFVCSNTKDKIFLLSEQEATKSDYGFAVYDQGGTGNTRIRMTTAFAQENGAFQDSTEGYGYGGHWWLRSPRYNDRNYARVVLHNGDVSHNGGVNNISVDVVPALCLE